MDLGLKDKVAIVTGSARGLGAATARPLADEGARVVIPDIKRDRALQMQPIKRPGRPEDVADAVAFLASERASFICGEVLHVIGGRYG